ncbi:MAG: O-antigen ligase family protein, partial [Cyanobacteria bacterium]|nr:O-antigen ligase family protein [Cyanobacteriota bacterium]
FSIFSLFGIFEYFTHGSILIRSSQRMFLALNFAHNATGSVYAVAGIFALIFFLYERNRNKKILYFLLFLILAVALILTKSRGSLLGFVAGIVFVFWMYFRSFKKFIIAFAAVVVVSVPFVILSGLYKRFINIFSEKGDANTIIRLDLWSKAWHLFLRSPIFGIGFGRINDVYDIYDGVHLTGYEGGINFYMGSHIITTSSHAHNSYLQFLAETGIIGLGLLILFWVFCFRLIFKAYFSSNNKFSKILHLSALSSVVILFVLSLTENYFSASTVMILVSMVVSLSVGLSWQENNLKRELKN